MDLHKPGHQFIHHVAVGSQGSPTFVPQWLNANIGDQIVFKFHALNHTLTQSSLERPCASLQQFDTGFNQFNPHSRDKLVTIITVNSLEPQWFFCRQNTPASHCHMGMVFAINPGDQMDTFFQNARRESTSDTSSIASMGSRNVSPTKPILRSSSSQSSLISPTISPADPSFTHVSESIPNRPVASTDAVSANPMSSLSPVQHSSLSKSEQNHLSITPISLPPMSHVTVTQTATQNCPFPSVVESFSPGHSPTPSMNYASFQRIISRSNMTSEETGSAIVPNLIAPAFCILLIAAFLWCFFLLFSFLERLSTRIISMISWLTND